LATLADRGSIIADGHVGSTIGAGDTFIAGVLFGILCHFADWDTEASLQFAVDLATQKVQIDGFEGLGAAAATRLRGV
jgi:ketohexokinase